MSILHIKNGRVIDPEQEIDEVRDVWIADGTVAAEGFSHPSPDEVIDATGMLVMPGFVDVHVHLREPGYEDAEIIETGCQAALAGGFTSIVCMPNTDPAMDCPKVVQQVLDKAWAANGPRVYAMPTVTVGRTGEALVDVESLLMDRVDGLTDDGSGVKDEGIARRAMEFCAEHDLVYAEHCEVAELSAGGVMHPGCEAQKLGLPPYPPEAETAMIERDIRLAEETGADVHFQHLSSARSVELIKDAKARGINVTAEVTPHHLTLTAKDAAKGGTNFKMNPPLRSEAERRALVQGLKDGIIDMIATDHAPHTPESKAKSFLDAPNGVIGMETAASVIWTKLVKAGILTPYEMVERMSSFPRRAFTYLYADSGALAPNFCGDAVIFDPNAKWTVAPEEFKSKSRNCPFNGWELEGRVAYTIVGGEVKYRANLH